MSRVLRWSIVCAFLFLQPACMQAQSGAKPATNTETIDETSLSRVDRFGPRFAKLNITEQAFVRGVATFEQGRWGDAHGQFWRTREDPSLPQDDLNYYLGYTSLRLNDYQSALMFLRDVSAQSRWFTEAQYAVAETLLAYGQYDAAQHAIDEGLQPEKLSHAQQRRWELLRIDLLGRRQQQSAVRSAYRQLYEEAQFAAEIEAIPADFDPRLALKPQARRELAEQFLERGLASEAVTLLKPLAAQDRVAKERLAWAHFRARQYPAARDLFQELAQSGSVTMNRLLVTQRYASAAARSQDSATAITLHADIMKRYPRTRSASVSQYKRAWLMQDSGQCGAARKEFASWRQLETRVKTKDADALWLSAWCAYRQGDWSAALTALDALEALPSFSHKRWQSKVAYWRGRTLAQAGQRKQAILVWQTLAADKKADRYHRFLAQQQLRKRVQQSLFTQGKVERPDAHVPMEEAANDTVALRLLDLGLWDHAVAELDAAEIELTFGARHHVALEHLAAPLGLDAELMRALIRQESLFKPAVVSRAGAIGLMQLMPQTARRMAAALDMSQFHESQLADPLTNMRLGLWYFRGLLKRYAGVVPHALAAYNAGEDAVDRWRTQFADYTMDEFIESIPYRETRRYVQRILGHYWSATR